jgi:AcrR family transcriptional regulator
MAGRLSASAHKGGTDTRARIIAATLQTLRDDGIVGATARTIARAGDFNQALIFYHFGSVQEVLVAAAIADSDARAARYAPELESVHTLADLVAVARRLHDAEMAAGGLSVLTQLAAGAAQVPELREGLMQSFRPWMQLVEDAVARSVEGTALSGLVPTEQVSQLITALFLGLEQLQALQPGGEFAAPLLATIEGLARTFEPLLRLGAPPSAAGAKKKR